MDIICGDGGDAEIPGDCKEFGIDAQLGVEAVVVYLDKIIIGSKDVSMRGCSRLGAGMISGCQKL